MTVAKDGGHLWAKKHVHGEDMHQGIRRRETVTSNEERTISSVGVLFKYFVNCARANGTRLIIFSTISNS